MVLSWEEMQIQRNLDIYVRVNRPTYLSATDPVLIESVGYDLSKAEDAMKIFYERHENDAAIVGKNPLILKIYTTFYGGMRR